MGSYIAGAVDVIGNARGGPFRLEIGAGLEPGEWTLIGSERGDEVANGVLQQLDTRTFGEGLYTLRLTVNRGDGPRVQTIPVTVDNTAPTAIITEPKADRLYVMEEDEQININVLANDNFVIDRVEFLLNNATILTATVSPYNARWEIDMRDVNSAAGGLAWTPFVSDDPDIQPGTVVTYGDGF